ncbi:MAG: hypothetical protein KC464_27655 [Myxococcales bacterium]|nr:hypothetical protein [Myxococcales bacterium]
MKISPRSAPAESRPPAATRLGAILAGAPILVDVEVERIGLKAKLRLLTRSEEEGVTLRVAAWLAELAGQGVGHDLLQAVAAAPVSSRHAVEMLAIAVRDPDDPARPFGALAEWTELDDTVLGELWGSYQDLVDQYDPERRDARLTEAEAAEILDAAQKKNRTALVAFGAQKLSLWACTTADLLAASPTPKS